MVSPTRRSPTVSLAAPYQRTERTTRRPQHPYNIQTLPFLITPVMLAPVLPGETLTGLMLQAQTWSDPLAGTLKNTGWWNEYNVFYVKHRDMPGWEIGVDGLGKDLIDMFVNNESLLPEHIQGGNVRWGAAPNGVNFVLPAMQRVVEEYFRDEGETAGAYAYAAASHPGLQGYMKAQIYGRGRDDMAQKLTLASAYEDHRQKLDIDGDGQIYVGDEMNRAFTEWAAAHDAGLITMTYQDWMRTYGGEADHGTEPDRVDQHRPEDIDYTREFTYPTNTVEPTTGIASVAVGWRTAYAYRKKHRFEEPGWILVTQTVRPKVYLGNQAGLMASMMTDRNAWLPAVLNAESTVGHRTFAETDGPFSVPFAVSYMTDMRDLFLYGEQFINYAMVGGTTPGFPALPTATGQRRYMDDASIDNLFSAPATGVIRSDGMISLSILGRQREDTNNLKLYRA